MRAPRKKVRGPRTLFGFTPEQGLWAAPAAAALLARGLGLYRAWVARTRSFDS